MNLITRNNYEAYMLDYVEENLAPELIAELMLFLENNPDLKEELDAFEVHKLTPTELTLLFKESLKKSEELITPLNYEDYLIKEIEGKNSKEETISLQLFLEQNPDAQKEYELYQKTKLVASTIIFNDKKSLKKKEGMLIPMYVWYSSAAAILLILFLLKGLNIGNTKENNPIADKVEEKVINETQENFNVEEKEDELEENNLAEVKVKNVPPVVIPKNNKKEIPKKKKIVPQEEAPKIELAENFKEEIKDTLPIIQEKIQEEEVLYTDNVMITYEEAEKKDDVVKETPSRFKLIKEVLNQRVKNKILQQDKDQNGEVTAYAVSVAGIGFSKNKKINK